MDARVKHAQDEPEKASGLCLCVVSSDAGLMAHSRRLIGAAVGFERLGDNAGGVFRPRMVRAVRLGVRGERGLANGIASAARETIVGG